MVTNIKIENYGTHWIYQYCVLYLAWWWFSEPKHVAVIFNFNIHYQCMFCYWLDKLLHHYPCFLYALKTGCLLYSFFICSVNTVSIVENNGLSCLGELSVFIVKFVRNTYEYDLVWEHEDVVSATANRTQLPLSSKYYKLYTY